MVYATSEERFEERVASGRICRQEDARAERWSARGAAGATSAHEEGRNRAASGQAYSHCIAAAGGCFNEQLGRLSESLSHHSIALFDPAFTPCTTQCRICVRAPSSDAMNDTRAWTHGQASARQHVLCANAEAGTHAGRALTHLLMRAVEAKPWKARASSARRCTTRWAAS